MKSRNKAIFIEKDRSSNGYKRFEALSKIAQNLEKREQVEKVESETQKGEVIRLRNLNEEGTPQN